MSVSSTTPSHLATALQREHPEWVSDVIEALGEVTVVVPREHIVKVCSLLKATPESQFDFLADLCGADLGLEEEPRFEVNYHLFSTTEFHRLRLKVLVQRARRSRADSDRRLAHGKLARTRDIRSVGHYL